MPIAYPLASIAVGAVLALAGATAVGAAAVRAGFPTPAGDRRIGCVDGLRGYLALSVLVHHFVIWMQVTRLGGTWSAPGVALLNNLGAGGVALFFMTTGLVFYPRVLAGFRATSWVSVAVTRVFRIVPLVAVSVLAVAAVVALRTHARPGLGDLRAVADWLTARAQPPLLGYPDSGRVDAYVLWSLRYEWVFYLAILPSCALAMDLLRPRAATWALPIGLLAIWLAAGAFHPAWALMKYLPLFAVGMLAFEIQRVEALRRLLGSPWMAAPAGASLVAGLVSAPNPYGLPQLALVGFFFVAVACGNSLFGCLRTRGALALGECSYAIYLLHGIALSLLFVEGRSSIGKSDSDAVLLALPAVAVVLACVTSLVYLLVERRFIRLGRQIVSAKTERRLSMAEPIVDVAP